MILVLLQIYTQLKTLQITVLLQKMHYDCQSQIIQSFKKYL